MGNVLRLACALLLFLLSATGALMLGLSGPALRASGLPSDLIVSAFPAALSLNRAVLNQTQVVPTIGVPDFAISVSPSRLTFPLAQNTTLDTNVSVASLGGFSGTVNLTISTGSNYRPAQQMPSANPTSKKVPIMSSSAVSFPLAISVNSSMIAAPYWADVKGVDQTTGFSHTYEFVIVIGPDFNITMPNRNLIVHQGQMNVSTVTFTSINGFNHTIAAYSGLIPVNPPYPAIDLYPPDPTLLPGGTNTSRLVIKTDSNTGLGTYQVAIEATDVTAGWISGGLAYNVTVLGPTTDPDFAMYADPVHLSTSLGSNVTSTVNLIGQNGFTGLVKLYAFSAGAGTRVTPESLLVSSGANVTSKIEVNIASPNGEAGGYTPWWFASGIDSVLVIASGPTGLGHEAWVNVTATPFTVNASPTRQEVKANSTATFDVTVGGIGGFNDTVSVNPEASPGVTATLGAILLNFSGAPSTLSSSLTVKVPPGTPDGDYVVQVSATYMRPDYVCSCAPKHPLTYTLPVHVLVTSPASPLIIFGLPPVEFYAIVAGAGAAAVITASYLVLRVRKPVRSSKI